jgi:primary-amine oxidase
MRIETLGILIVAVGLTCGATTAAAHEFWVAPQSYSVQPGDRIITSLRVGKMMRGTDLPYLSHNFHSFTITTPNGTQDVEGIEGDTPALSYTADVPGLHVTTYHSTAKEVTYDDWETFRKYLAHEGLEEIEQTHHARGLPDSGFKEVYTRVAKSLVQVGPVSKKDRDTPRGLPLELVAEDNPYTPGLETMRVTLLSLGKPVAGRQIAVFRYDGEVSRTVITTDTRGQVAIPVAGGGTFLLNATDLQPAEDGNAVWASYWASLTFGLPTVLRDVHPLDPLSSIEIARAIRVIGKSGFANQKTRVSLVTLAEPDKAEVLAWTPDKPARRQAFSVIRNGPEVFEATIDLVDGTLERLQPVPGIQPPIQNTEWARAQRLTKEDPRWIEAMRVRGYDDVSQIFCESLSAGFFDLAEERGRRLLKMPCYDQRGTKTNIYGRPIEGLISVVDLDKGEVVRVIDEGQVPVSEDTHSFDEASVPALRPSTRPVRTAAPAGWNFTIDGHLVSWNPWSFHIGFDQRFGPVLSLVTHKDGSSRRMILYQGHLSEVFVPYMDPAEGWYYRSYMDSGEYGLGSLSSPLTPGLDCPEGATFLDATLVTPIGAAYTRERVMCIFERDSAAPLWRHWEALNDAYEGRPTTELVVRSIPTIGNYDYVVDWVLNQKGEIQINIGATGIDAVKGVAIKNMNEPGAKEATRSGVLVAPNLVAVHHDHYFSIRLDLDVDGPINTLVRERLTPVSLPEEHPRRSLWQLEPVPMPNEGALAMHDGPELWRIENPEVETALGHRPSYQIQAGSTATSLLSPQDWPQRRAAFSAKTLWITARRPGELFAAGPYPNQSPGGDGLSAYVDGESIVATDVVAWYTMGFHHLTRPEDWPVLPTVWHGVRLRPYGFFTNNPGLGVRRDFIGEGLKSQRGAASQ